MATTTPGTVRTSVLIMSDTHLAGPFPTGVPADLPHIDLLIHAGDLTMLGTPGEFEQALDMLRLIPADVKVAIAGNHDLGLDRVWTSRSRQDVVRWLQNNYVNTSMVGELGEEGWRRAEGLWFGPQSRAEREGVTMLREGRSSVRLKNGAKAEIYATPFTPEFWDWGFAYYKHEDRFNPRTKSLLDATNIAVNPAYDDQNPTARLDIMITHGPPYGRLDQSARGNLKVGCPHLLNALQHCRPQLHCFGHIHEGWGAELINWATAAPMLPSQPVSVEDFCQSWDGASASGCVERVPVKEVDPVATVPAEHSPQANTTTLVVNAAIMDVSYQPINRPWLVHLDLPCA